MPRLPLLLPRELDDSSLRGDEPLIPSLELLELEPLEPLDREPDDALMPSSLREVERSLPLVDEPFVEALSPPDRSCEFSRPELVLPEAPSPSLRVLLSPTLLELRSPLVLRSLLVLRLLSEAL